MGFTFRYIFFERCSRVVSGHTFHVSLRGGYWLYSCEWRSDRAALGFVVVNSSHRQIVADRSI